MPSSSLPHRAAVSADMIDGAVEIEITPAGLLPHRLPAWARAQCQDAQLAMVEAQPAGVRLRFQSAATTIELHTLPTKRVYLYMPARPDGVYDLLVDGVLTRQASASGGTVMQIDMARGTSSSVPGEVQTLRFADLPATDKTIEIWLPHDETTVLVALHADAPVAPVAASRRRRWLHHGSSISQGSNAAHPSGTWPAVAAARAGVELRNLGLGGSAMLDPFTARTMRDLPADIISVKLGINLVNTDSMRLRAFGPAVHGFLDTLREGHRSTPLYVVSPVLCPIHETVPGPSMVDTGALREGRLSFRASGKAEEVRQGKLTLEVIRAQLQAIVALRAQSDPNIYYIDGLALYGLEDNARLPLPDGLHPDGESHRLMGERFADLVLAAAAEGGVAACGDPQS